MIENEVKTRIPRVFECQNKTNLAFISNIVEKRILYLIYVVLLRKKKIIKEILNNQSKYKIIWHL